MRKWIRRSLKLGLVVAGALLVGGLVYYAGGGLPLRGGNLREGTYEVAWRISTGQRIPEQLLKQRGQEGQDPDHIKWSWFRNWVLYVVRPKDGTFYRAVVEYSPMQAETYFTGPRILSVFPPRKKSLTPPIPASGA